MNYYPVCIPTLCRYEHLKKCVESLLKCPEAKYTELIVSVDYPTKDSHKHGRLLIIDYIKKLHGFGKITLFIQDKNLGAQDNWAFLREYAFEKYGASIMTEDDNVFATCFLNYMDNVLDYYWDDERIMSITGYSPIGFESIKDPIYFSYSFCAWGLGLWKHKSYDNDSDVSYYKAILDSTKHSLKLFLRLPSALNGLINIIQSKERLGDYGLGAQNVLKERFQMRPRKTLVINCGQDGSGLHSGINTAFHQAELNRGFPLDISFNCDFSKIKVSVSPFVRRYMFWRYGGFGRYHIIPQCKTIVRYFFYRFK